MGEDWDKEEPISDASAKSTCDPYYNSLCCALAAARTVPVG